MTKVVNKKNQSEVAPSNCFVERLSAAVSVLAVLLLSVALMDVCAGIFLHPLRGGG